MSSEPKSQFWKPGEARPAGLASKKKKKRRKRKNKNKKEGQAPEETKQDGTNSTGVATVSHARDSIGKKRRREEGGEREASSGAVFSSIPSRSNDYYIKPSAASAANQPGSKRPKFSDSLRKLKFMARKKKPMPKQKEKKWVLPSSSTNARGKEDTEKKLVCVPLETRPVISSRFGRKSFKRFNRNVDSFNAALHASEGARKVAKYVEETAIGQEEMSEFHQRLKSKR